MKWTLGVICLLLLGGLLACTPTGIPPATAPGESRIPPRPTPAGGDGATPSAIPSRSPAPAAARCPPLPAPSPPTVTVSTEADLRDQAYNAAPGTTILVAAGTYTMQDFVHIVHRNIALRGATGNRDDVVLDFGGVHFGILVEADDVTITDLTIRNASDHGVAISGNDRPILYNLHIQDASDQLVKVNPLGDGSDDGLLACSRLEYTTTAPDEYTNGISAHNAHRWTVRDNEWYRIRTPGNSPVPTILFWSGSSDTVVERNLLVDCYQGISFGNASHGPGDHSGGIVRNNVIYASQPHDVVIEMVHADGWLVANNTALLLNPAPGLTWGMEARFADTVGTFSYNLTNMAILLDRDGAQATGMGNVVNAQSDWFMNASRADLHLLGTATAAIDRAALLTEVPDDMDGEVRPSGSAPDVGADEYTAVAVPTGTTHLPLVTRSWPAPAPTATPGPTVTPAPTLPSGGLVQPGDLVYLGAFRLPGGDTPPQTFAYGGNAMTFNPDGDPTGPADGFPGSLFLTGHDRQPYGALPDGGQVAEVNIPVPVISADMADLNTAGFLQDFHNVLAGYFTNLEEIPQIGMGYLNHPDTGPLLHLCWGQHFQEDPETRTASHVWFNATLDTPDVQGPWFIGNQNLYSVNGYMFDIPVGWADAHAQGRYLATGRFREGGWGGMGPALLAYRPWLMGGTPPISGTHISETVLLLYENSYNTEEITRCLQGYQHPDGWEGGAWLTAPSGKEAVLFVGTKSNGVKYWYGFINPAGPEYPCVDPEITDFPTCRWADGSLCPPEDLLGCCDPNLGTCVSERGWWSTRFDAQFLFYNPADLARVASSELGAWEPQPYATLDVDEHLYLSPPEWDLPWLGWGEQRHFRLGPAAYDRENGLLYVLELFADGARPVVHVWQVR